MKMDDQDRIHKVGFIGLGLMGKEMASNIMEAGFNLWVWNRTRAKATELLEAGASWSESPRELARETEIVITMVTDSAASEEVVCGPDGILEGAQPGLILIDMSSIEPEMSRSIADRAREKGVEMLDAPVTGNPRVASRGKLGIMVGGPAAIFEKCLPVFKTMGEKIVFVSEENGAGTTLKLINNLILGTAIMASAEALVLARKAGINPQRVIDITSVGGARTGAMETRGPRMVQREFSPHFSANNMYKDLSNALSLADKLRVTLPVTGMSRDFLRPVLARGQGEMDSCIVMTVLEEMADIKDDN